MNLKRITRLLKLLQILQSDRGDNANGLAVSCGVSRRTVFRDIETLKSAGVPVQFDSKLERYKIDCSFFLPPTNLTEEEALSVITLASQLGSQHGLPFYEPAFQGALKVQSGLPSTYREKLETTVRSIHIRIPQINSLSDKNVIYQQLIKAIASRRVVQIQYQSLTEWDTISTKLRPYKAVFLRRSWYVIGRSSLHRSVRIFNLARIVTLKSLREKYSIPSAFNIDKYLGNAWSIIPGTGTEYNVVVRFQPLVAQSVAGVIWHKTQESIMLEDGSLEYCVNVSSLDEIAWWILGYGDLAEVLQPEKLRNLVASRVNQMQNIYNKQS